jgi:hypothetical protein
VGRLFHHHKSGALAEVSVLRLREIEATKKTSDLCVWEYSHALSSTAIERDGFETMLLWKIRLESSLDERRSKLCQNQKPSCERAKKRALTVLDWPYATKGTYTASAGTLSTAKRSNGGKNIIGKFFFWLFEVVVR